ncbi:hypothetical protein ACWD6I_23475, partial [Streptomyces sp. NPDC002454]
MAVPRRGEGVLRRKPIEHVEETEEGAGPGLARSLGLWQLTAIGVGGIIGAGIFTLAGTVANGTAGPAVLLSFLIAGVASACADPRLELQDGTVRRDMIAREVTGEE